MKIFPTAIIPPRPTPAPADPNAGLREPGTDYLDRRNYRCDNCGRRWRKFSKQYRCPHYGYAVEQR